MNKLGAIPSEYSEKDYSVKVVSVQQFPEEYLLKMGTPYYQNAGNCVAQAARGRFRKHFNKEFGVNMVYGGARKNHYGEGLIPSEAADFIVKYGIAPLESDKGEDEVSEVIARYHRYETSLKSAAEDYKAFSWSRPETVSEVKASIMAGVPVMVSMPWYAWDTDRMYRVADEGELLGFHEVLVVGWKQIAGEERAAIFNSHGTSFGDRGIGYATWEHIFTNRDLIILTIKSEEKAVESRRTLRLKSPYMKGDDVKECQEKLEKHGFDVGKIDGVFGSGTDKAVKAFQKAKGLGADGIVGKLTWAELDKEPNTKDHSEEVKALEELLKLMVGDYYVIGGQGHELTKSYLDSRRNAESNYFTDGRYEYLIGEIEKASKLNRKIYCEDCSGLFMKANEVLNIIPIKDTTANGIWSNYCTEISKSEVRAGDILFYKGSNGKMVHMAVVGNEGTYEAAGTAYGVVKHEDTFNRKVKNNVTGKIDTKSNWTHYGRLKVWA